MASTRTSVTALLGSSSASSPRIIMSFASSDSMVFSLDSCGYNGTSNVPRDIAVHSHYTAYVVMSYTFSDSEAVSELVSIAQFFGAAEAAFANSTQRWNNHLYIATRRSTLSPTLAWLAAKSLCTLITNWRGSADVFFHGGLFPYFSAYQGFWGWDSWKHARALAHIDPVLAISQVCMGVDRLAHDVDFRSVDSIIFFPIMLASFIVDIYSSMKPFTVCLYSH